MNRVLTLALIGGLVAVIALVLNFWVLAPDDVETSDRDGDTQTQEAAKPDGTEAQQPATSAEDYVKPSFDVLRIDRNGSAVIAGRAEPNAEVTILDDDKPLGTVKADDRGQWVFVPDGPLAPGNRHMGLEQKLKDGRVVSSDSVVLLIVPERDVAENVEQPSDPIAIEVSRLKPGIARVLIYPSGRTRELPVNIRLVDYDREGNATIAGEAPPDAAVNVYVDNRHVGAAKANKKGLWTLSPDKPVPAGRHTLRADQVDAEGNVLVRIELPFIRSADVDETRGTNFVQITRGNSLWHVARQAYGTGFRFTNIYQANQQNIRDPDLIYPGQIFQLPVGEEKEGEG